MQRNIFKRHSIIFSHTVFIPSNDSHSQRQLRRHFRFFRTYTMHSYALLQHSRVAKAFTARKISGRSAEGSARGEMLGRRPPIFLETPDPDPRCRDDPAIARTSNGNCGITVSFQRIPPVIRTTWTDIYNR